MRSLREIADSGALLNCNIVARQMPVSLVADRIEVEWQWFEQLSKVIRVSQAQKSLLLLFSAFQACVLKMREDIEKNGGDTTLETSNAVEFSFRDVTDKEHRMQACAFEQEKIKWLIFTPVETQLFIEVTDGK